MLGSNSSYQYHTATLMVTSHWLLGDYHGHFYYILETVENTGERPVAVLFLGDLECSGLFSDCVAGIESEGI